jgi:hypothetical protein
MAFGEPRWIMMICGGFTPALGFPDFLQQLEFSAHNSNNKGTKQAKQAFSKVEE